VSEYIGVAVSTLPDTAEAAREVIDTLSPMSPAVVFIFHGTAHSGGLVAETFSTELPGVVVVGCTTMGEIAPHGFVESSITAFAMGQPCRAAAERIPDLESFRFAEGGEVLSRLAGTLGLELDQLDPDRHVVVTLTDGLSSNEEQLLGSLGDAVPDLPLVGGSAGDDFEMTATHCFVGENAGSGGAVVLILEPGVAFQPFAIHQYEPGGEDLVVTGADPEHRILTELNGWPAVKEFSRISGFPEEDFRSDPNLAAAVPTQLGFRIGDVMFIRGIMAVKPEGLVLAAAVEEGMVLHTAKSSDIVETTVAGVADAISTLGVPAAGLLLFNCGGRLVQARRNGRLEEHFDSMAPVLAAGFHTYGEHYSAVLVTYTMTGVAFGTPAAAHSD
jgi:hypothetical protein